MPVLKFNEGDKVKIKEDAVSVPEHAARNGEIVSYIGALPIKLPGHEDEETRVWWTVKLGSGDGDTVDVWESDLRPSG